MITSANSQAGERIFAPMPDGSMSVLRFGAAGARPMLFAHANGFCASAYRQMFAALGRRFDIFAVDLRGFGSTKLPADPALNRSMEIFATDIGRAADELRASQSIVGLWIFAGHSLGATSAAIAATGREDVEALRLIEPVATPRWFSFLARTPIWPSLAARLPLVRGARGRRRVWPDRASVVASYAKKPLFSTWAPGVLEDYLEDGLKAERGAVEGPVELACAPEWEAATFAGQAHDFWGALKHAPCPVRVWAARHPSTTVRAFARRRLVRMGAELVTIEGRTHLAPFEDPAAAAEFLAAP